MTIATTNVPSTYTSELIQIWLRGLLTVAWADGHFDEEEKQIIHTMVDSEFAPNVAFESLEPIEPAALLALELSDAAAQNFLPMAVLLAPSTGPYPEAETDQTMAFAEATPPDPEALAPLRPTLENLPPTHLPPP
ncbi:MAG: nitrogenase, partial [Phormidesmis sp.]